MKFALLDKKDLNNFLKLIQMLTKLFKKL